MVIFLPLFSFIMSFNIFDWFIVPVFVEFVEFPFKVLMLVFLSDVVFIIILIFIEVLVLILVFLVVSIVVFVVLGVDALEELDKIELFVISFITVMLSTPGPSNSDVGVIVFAKLDVKHSLETDTLAVNVHDPLDVLYAFNVFLLYM